MVHAMPELPEVETVRTGLSQLIVGKQFKAVSHDWPKSFPNASSDVNLFLIGATIESINRRAKVLVIELNSGYSLVIHLKMTGQLVFIHRLQKPEITDLRPITSEIRFGAGHPNDSLINELPDKSTRVSFEFSDYSWLYFNDQRKFGWVRLMPTIEIFNLDFFKKLGPEPLGSDLTAEEFAVRFARRKNSTIKAALLDQTIIAGVGNIYADESLWAAKIHPETLVRNVPALAFNSLFTSLRAVLLMSIEKGGSSDRNYVNAEGKKGSYLAFAEVFRREGEQCRRCSATIIKLRVAGRGTHICPTCQVKVS
ncbi:MAG: DNA-formamidopyrimidine glycosylase [Candidatus Saccharimonadales bacterium]